TRRSRSCTHRSRCAWRARSRPAPGATRLPLRSSLLPRRRSRCGAGPGAGAQEPAHNPSPRRPDTAHRVKSLPLAPLDSPLDPSPQTPCNRQSSKIASPRHARLHARPMFDFVHKHKRFIQILLGVIALTFATWGIESYTRMTGGRDTVAKVNGEEISAREFDE